MAVGVLGLRLVSLSTRRYMNGVADFLSANRCGGRYLLSIASGMGTTGAISFMSFFEMYYAVGFSPTWWNFMLVHGSVIALTGFVYYRYRETRALTLAQYLEMRYSRKFRVFAGVTCWATGVLNFAIYPVVGARFFVYYCGMPEYFHVPGIPYFVHLAGPMGSVGFHTGNTLAVVMLVDLLLALTFVVMGGQISVMVTEGVQWIFCAIAAVVVTGMVIFRLHWPGMAAALNTAPANSSMMNPFHTSHVKDFNVWYFLIGMVYAYYTYMAWQGSSGYYCAAKSPHEQKMSSIISLWRTIPINIMILVLPVAVFALLRMPEFAQKAAVINRIIGHIGNTNVQNEMRVPIAMSQFLPVGVKGLLATIILFASFSCTDTYIHGFGSIFIQDVYMPLRKKELPADEHIRLLRWSIVSVAAFAFIFGLIYPPDRPIAMFLVITGTIWLVGAGSAIIGGLYWKKGTTAAAYAAISIGITTGFVGLIVPPIYNLLLHKEFPVNNQWVCFIGMCCASVTYIVVSLITSRGREFNLDRMLHRGKWATGESQVSAAKWNRWQALVGITEEFTTTDKVFAVALVSWVGAWFCFFLVITVMNLVHPFGNAWWAGFWHFYIWLYFIMSIPIVIWFTVGGLSEIKALFHALATEVRDNTDDGRVIEQCEDPEQELLAKSAHIVVPELAGFSDKPSDE